MDLRSRRAEGWLARSAMGGLLAALLLLAGLGAPAQAALLPQGFFDMPIKIGKGPVGVEAQRMSYDAAHNTVAAEGGATFRYGGYVIRADRISYDQVTGSLTAAGNVEIRDPGGDLYLMDSIEIQGPLKQAFVKTLAVTTADGALVTATDAHYGDALQTILTDATYSPCGLCEDNQGRKIGWKVKSARIIYDRKNASVTLEQPSLELLGLPVAWLPWFWVPDPTQPRARGLRMPSIGGDANRGVSLTVPYFIPAGEDVDIILSPTLMSRQGFLMQGEVNWRLPPLGEIDVKASGVYQLDPGAYAGTVGDRAWRGAIQSSGHFTPAPDWTAGWSYTAFTDNQYLYDYGYSGAGLLANRIFATRLTDESWFDARLVQFHRLGNYTSATGDDPQALVLPQISYDEVHDLAPGLGRVHVTGELLDVYRGADDTNTFNTVPYVNGNQGSKEHLMLEGGWEDQFILPGGVAATPYLGTRFDVANYSRGAPPIGGGYTTTPDAMLLTATPIAALDVRWPLMASNGADTHLFEPIGQLVYRGSDTTAVGVTNDDAQSFVFDDTNLFSYNRFSGIDRQETGLRANLGGHYVGNFGDGSWVDLIAGQSFQLAGLNALGVSDTSMTGTDTGLGSAASYIVAGARGGFTNGLTFGGKLQVDPAAPRVTRAGAGFDYSPGPHLFSTGADYIYVAADPALGTVAQHQVSGRVGVPITDYWTVNSGVAYDLAVMNWASVTAGATYDDGYLVYGASASATPTSWGLGVTFHLKGPDHKTAF